MPTGSVNGSGQGGVRGLLQGLQAPASGIRAQKTRIDTIAFNLAQAGTSAPPGEEAYRRRVVELESVPSSRTGGALAQPAPPAIPAPSTPGLPLPAELVPDPAAGLLAAGAGIGAEGEGVQVRGLAEDPTDGPLIYDPGHPHADEQGYVRYANVQITQEMVDLLEARRFFEANATVFEAMKSVLRRSIDL